MHATRKTILLHCACKCRAAPIALFEDLIRLHPASVSTPNSNHQLPLHVALKFGLSLDVLRLLLFDGCVSIADKRGYTSLHWAAETMYRAPNQYIGQPQPESGAWPVASAADEERAVHAVEMLLALDSQAARLTDLKGSLPLHTAAKNQAAFGVVKLLVDAFEDGLNQAASFVVTRGGNGHKGAKSAVSVDGPDAFVDMLPLHCALNQIVPDCQTCALMLDRAPQSAFVKGGSRGGLPLHFATFVPRGSEAFWQAVAQPLLALNKNAAQVAEQQCQRLLLPDCART